MSGEKQIEEMACENCMHHYACVVNSEYVPSPCKAYESKAGYRKQRDGEWQIKTEIHRMLDDVDEEIYVECPFCKRTFWVPYEFEDKKIFEYAREHYPYCNCGAKMKGGTE